MNTRPDEILRPHSDGPSTTCSAGLFPDSGDLALFTILEVYIILRQGHPTSRDAILGINKSFKSMKIAPTTRLPGMFGIAKSHRVPA